MSSAAPWGPMRSFHHSTLQTLDGEEKERRIYYLSRSERRYTNFNWLRCSVTMDRSDRGGVVQKSKRLSIYFYLGHETSVLAHKRQTVRKVSLDTRDFPSRPLCPLPYPVPSFTPPLAVPCSPIKLPCRGFFYQLFTSASGALGNRQ